MTRAPQPNRPVAPRHPILGLRLGLASLTVALCLLHSWLVWTAMGGHSGFTNGTVPWRDDHPLYFHSALATRHFLSQTGTTAGYDPAFMSGYAKSVVFPSSSTLPEVVIALFGRLGPVEVYKAYVFISAALVAWLLAVAAILWRVGPGGACASVALFLLYVWSDFPMRYAAFGMLPYLLAIPLGLVATGTFCIYCERGGAGWWLVSTNLMALDVLCHVTSAMIVVPAAAAAYVAAFIRRSENGPFFPRLRHAGVWSIPLVVIAVNAFWWLPGLWLASTKGVSDFAFAHPEGFWRRIWQIATTEEPIERVLCVLGLVGLGVLFASTAPGPRKAGLATFVAAGFFWGYMSGSFRALDFLQPGRHTFAFFSGLSVAAGILVGTFFGRLRERSRSRLDVVGTAAIVGFISWYVGPALEKEVRARVFARVPFLSSQPSPWLQWVIRNVRTYVKPGERLLYEEGGFAVEGVPDPFQGGRFSGILADKLGIELIGGPYLHASLTTNFTQFGEGKLFGKKDWDRDWFIRYARLYRPAAILCWTPKSRAFCLANPDLIEVKEDGVPVLIGRVIGFDGAAISGSADVVASPGNLRVTKAEGGLDGTVVLRYHSVPCLRSDPAVDWEPVYLEGDPVPFIKLRPPQSGAVTFRLRLPPGPLP